VAATNLVVEFLGLPGAGKSSLSHLVAAQLAEHGVTVAQPSYELAHGPQPRLRRLRKMLHVARELVTHPFATARAARIVGATRQPDAATRTRLLFNWLLVVALARGARTRPGVHLLDQGVLQAVWSIALEDRSETALQLLADPALALALPDVAVVVAARLDVVHDRLCSRSAHDSRVERRRGGLVLLGRGEQLVQRVRETAAGRTLVLEVRNEGDLRHGAAALADRLHAIVAGSLAANPSAG
jgi:hypothetical protein